MAKNDECRARKWAREATPEQVEKLMLDLARHRQARAALISEIAQLAKDGHGRAANRMLRRMDEALEREVRLEDLTTPALPFPKR